MTDSLNALSASIKAKNAADLSEVYTDLGVAMLLKESNPSANFEQLLSLFNKEELQAVNQYQSKDKPLENSLSITLNEAKTNAQKAVAASQSADKEMNLAKERLDDAQEKLKSLEEALKAAEKAVKA